MGCTKLGGKRGDQVTFEPVKTPFLAFHLISDGKLQMNISWNPSCCSLHA